MINKSLLIFVQITIIRVLVLGILLFVYKSPIIMVYTDFPEYKSCDLGSLNMGYSQIICWLNIESIFSPNIMIPTFFLCCLRDTIYVNYADTCLGFRRKTVLFITVLLAFHPYLAVSAIKLTTSTIASFILCLFIFIIGKEKGLLSYSKLILIPLFLVRNSFLTFSTVFLLGSFFTSLIRKKIYEVLMSGLVLGVILLLYQFNDRDYLKLVMTLKNDYSFSSILEYCSSRINSPFFSYVIATILLLFSHFVMVLGFRESFYLQGISWFNEFTILKFIEVIGGLSLLFLHGVGFIGLFRIQKFDILLKISLIFVIFPGFLFVSHIRYLYPIIPLLLIGFTYYSSQSRFTSNYFK